jgi:hypothetical protein
MHSRLCICRRLVNLLPLNSGISVVGYSLSIKVLSIPRVSVDDPY